ncbi:hypothetical protein V8C26DRAFT_201124 [Trichoderma gracile]
MDASKNPRALALSQLSLLSHCLLHNVVSPENPAPQPRLAPKGPDSDAIPEPSSRPFKQRRHSDALAMGVSSCPIATELTVCQYLGKFAHLKTVYLFRACSCYNQLGLSESSRVLPFSPFFPFSHLVQPCHFQFPNFCIAAKLSLLSSRWW